VTVMYVDLVRLQDRQTTASATAAGDRMLVEVGQRWRAASGSTDTAARLGATSSVCFWRTGRTSTPRSHGRASARLAADPFEIDGNLLVITAASASPASPLSA